jgi:hypothetical protein
VREIFCQIDAISNLMIKKSRQGEIAIDDLEIVVERLELAAAWVGQELLRRKPRKQFWEDLRDQPAQQYGLGSRSFARSPKETTDGGAA